MRLTKIQAEIKAFVDRQLRLFFENKSRAARRLHPANAELVNEIGEFTLRAGKRLRPLLCWLGYVSTARRKSQDLKLGKLPEELVAAMLGLELFQTFALIHDDIIDEDLERRGGPTMHEHFKRKASKHFGESMALLAGDLALAWAFELLEQTGSHKAGLLFSKMAQETVFGQTLDVLRQQAGAKIAKARIDELKTSYYSVIRPLTLGALLAGASDRTLKSLGRYGLAVGAAFQLRDDVLDAEISELEFGQRVKPWLSQALQQVKRLPLPESQKELYRDLAKFVVIRKS